MATNTEKLNRLITKEHNPFIVYDIETTGIMNGNDNRVTQIALAKYDYNDRAKKYELIDTIFMLAKPNKEVIANIEKNEQPTKDNAINLLLDEYLYAYESEIKRVLKNCINRQKTQEKKIDKYDKEGNVELWTKANKKLEEEQKLEQELTSLFDMLKPKYFDFEGIDNAINTLKANDVWKEYIGTVPVFMNDKNSNETVRMMSSAGNVSYTSFDYVERRLDIKLNELQNAIKLDDKLKYQGIDKETWLEKEFGLTSSEMQIGINEFLNQYDSHNTVLISSGTYYTNHYLSKENMRLEKPSEQIIDISQVKKSQGADISKYTTSVSEFAKLYADDTGKEIKVFDALTKSLCYGEMVSKLTDIELSNRSIRQLENAVLTSSFNNDDNYVMSLASFSSHVWQLADGDDYYDADYHFNSLEHVDFGNDRRYVDIDKMFELNNNFEITLEGEKEPIKSWEELENKIKALNASISDKLLEKIKEKYEELEEDAKKKQSERKVEYDKKIPCPEVDYIYYDIENDNAYDDYEQYDDSADTPLTKHQKLLEDAISQFEEKYLHINEEYDSVSNELEKATQEYKDAIVQKENNIISDLNAVIPYIAKINQLLNEKERNYSFSGVRIVNNDIYIFRKFGFTDEYCIYNPISKWEKPEDDVLSTAPLSKEEHEEYVEDFCSAWDDIYDKMVSDLQNRLLKVIDEKQNKIEKIKQNTNTKMTIAKKIKKNNVERD